MGTGGQLTLTEQANIAANEESKWTISSIEEAEPLSEGFRSFFKESIRVRQE